MTLKFEKAQLYFLTLCLAVGTGGWCWYQSLANSAHTDYVTPEFAAFEDVSTRKQVFLDYLYPLVANANIRILQDRKKLLDLDKQLSKGVKLNREQSMMLEKFSLRYDIQYNSKNPRTNIKRLLARVDLVPVSLALAQAANETAWGTSRFATDANNYFGQWCFSEGCGLVPGARKDGEDHEVKVFSSPAVSVSAYLQNINRNRAYAEVRVLRLRLRQQKQALTGYALAGGLGKYSELGENYVSSIRSIIQSNQLQEYTHQFNASLARYPELQALVSTEQ